MNAAAVFKILTYVRNRLNLILIATHILKMMKWAAPIVGIIIILGRWCGWQRVGFLGGVILLTGGIMAGLFLGLKQHLGLMETANWLDRKLQDNEAFSAALVCLERSCEGIFDRSMVQRAALIADSNLPIHWPFKSIYRQIIQCIAAFGIMSIMMIFGFYLSPIGKMGLATLENPSLVEPGGKNFKSNSGRGALSPLMSNARARAGARALAGSLFPQDSKLAGLAEKALIRGDLESIKSLMKHSSMAFEEQLTQNTNLTPDQKRQMTKKHTEAMTALSQYQPIQSENWPQTVRKGSVPKDGKNNSSSGNMQKQQTKDSFLSGSGSISYDDIQKRIRSKGPEPLYQGNSSEGKSDNTVTLSGGKAKQKTMLQSNLAKNPADVKKVMIAKNKNDHTLEFVIPGKNSTIPVTQLIPSVKRQTEAAMEREGIPGEYQDFMRYYFSELSQKLQTEQAH